MKKLLTAFLFLFVAVCLSGASCATFTKTEHVLVKPDVTQVADCDMTRPPDIVFYTEATRMDKEALMYEYSQALQRDITKCNKQWDELRAWYDKQSKVYEKKPE